MARDMVGYISICVLDLWGCLFFFSVLSFVSLLLTLCFLCSMSVCRFSFVSAASLVSTRKD